MQSENREEYLEAIYGLLEEGYEVSPTRIARKLGINPSSVSEMLKKLDAEGFVLWKPYGNVELTKKGFKKASGMKRKHRLLERFLYDVLKIEIGKVHEQACRMEHSLSDEAAEALSKFMNHPAKCPDDNKRIPKGTEPESLRTLTDLKQGETASIVFLEGGDEFKNRIRSVGVVEGKMAKVVAKEPFGGPLVIKVGSTQITLGRGMASKVRVVAG
ncbi:MAG: metal-dependent transcriptional regulator [Candidatus Altiarchaeia archaeon]